MQMTEKQMMQKIFEIKFSKEEMQGMAIEKIQPAHMVDIHNAGFETASPKFVMCQDGSVVIQFFSPFTEVPM